MMYTNLDNSHSDYVNIMEVMYGIDSIDIDDNLFQISNFLSRSRNFINLKRSRYLKD